MTMNLLVIDPRKAMLYHIIINSTAGLEMLLFQQVRGCSGSVSVVVSLADLLKPGGGSPECHEYPGVKVIRHGPVIAFHDDPA